ALVAIGSGMAAAITNANLKKEAAANMAQGGIVPAGYPNDTYPALLTSGERVIPPGKLAERPITVVLQGNLRADMQEIWVTIEQAKELHNQTT
ncbi:MAG: hypothetical protein KJ556_20855, partial [Gammaproteobacteria bacterium]|nr:hypothetical protein [Gammaproteobacteria bacterium]